VGSLDVTWIIMVITNQSMLDIWRRWRNRVRSVIMHPGRQLSRISGNTHHTSWICLN